MVSWCPLCPHASQFNISQLAGHLSHTHRLHNSASTLAWIMVNSSLGMEQVKQVLEDVRQFQKSIDQKENQLVRTLGELSNFKLSKMSVHAWSQTEDQDSSANLDSKHAIDKSCQTLRISTSEKSCETEHDFIKPKEMALCDLGIGELKFRIQEKKAVVDILRKKISNTETVLKAITNENVNSVTKVLSELDDAKDTILKKNHEIVEWKQSAIKWKRNLRNAKRESSDERLELLKDRDLEKKESAQLIESQRLVHEKEIQDLNQKLQKQISSSQTLRSKEKTLSKEVELLTTSNSEKSDKIQSLTEQVNMFTEDALKLKMADQAMAMKLSNVSKDIEIKSLNKKVAELNRQVAVLGEKDQLFEKNVKELSAELAREKSNNDESFKTFQERTERAIAEKDKKILCLGKELERTKNDAYTIVEEMEKFTKLKLDNEKVKADMERKFETSREIFCLMKDSLAGMAAMQEDTSERLVEAVRNTAKASKIVINDVRRKFLEVENEVENLCKDVKDSTGTTLKKEPEGIWKSPILHKTMAPENKNTEVHIKSEKVSDDGIIQNSYRASYLSDFEKERGGSSKSLKRKFVE